MRHLILFAALVAGAFAFVGAAAAAPTVTPVAGAPQFALGATDLATAGYVMEEFFLAGTATSYRRAGPLGADGKWDAVAADSAPYVTRIVVIRPADAGAFNGTALVEWLNVSGGMDAAPDWMAAHREILRDGYAYIGVSAQKVGVEGGGRSLTPGQPLKQQNPARYGQLSHPGDAWAFDIFSEAGRAARGQGSARVLGPLTARRVIAMGESQSAIFLTTYVNAVDPLARVYDGFLIHSRFGSAPSVEGVSNLGGAQTDTPPAVRFRDDLRVPVLTLLTETDVLGGAQLAGYLGADQPDGANLRVWEVPGTAHADAYLFGGWALDTGLASAPRVAEALKPSRTVAGTVVALPINTAPQHHYVLEAAIKSLDFWIRAGEPPPQAARLAMLPAGPAGAVRFDVDANGNVKGGVRTPWVDVPLARLSGVGNSGGPLGFLVGVTEPFDATKRAQLYPGGKANYLARFDVALRASIRAGFILPADMEEIQALAAAMYPETP